MVLTAPNRTWAEVNLDSIAHNFHELRRVSGVRVMCVLKANAYGHGSCTLAKRLEKEGCDAFGVASLDEGIELRRSGVTAFILLFNHVAKERIGEALEHNLTMTVFSREMALHISERAANPVKIHIKTDTGMTRVGFNPGETLESVKYIHSLPNIEIEGIYTHFSSADEAGGAYTITQIDKLKAIYEEVENAGIPIKIKHAASSGGSINYPEARFDMVRIGISVYGCYPSEDIDKRIIDLKPAMQLKTQIVRINEAEPGTAVGYNRLFVTGRKSKIATILAGYADGIGRTMTGKLKVLVNGQTAPVIGRICMDQCMVDITDIAGEVAVSDTVVIYGEQKGAVIPVEQVAALIGTVNYEILCMMPRRVPRYYTENGEITGVVNFLNY